MTRYESAKETYAKLGVDTDLALEKLKELGYYNGAIDGIFGSQTIQAVKNFQRDYGLTVDGIVGRNTLAKLGLSGGSGSYSSSDIYSTVDFTYSSPVSRYTIFV